MGGWVDGGVCVGVCVGCPDVHKIFPTYNAFNIAAVITMPWFPNIIRWQRIPEMQ